MHEALHYPMSIEVSRGFCKLCAEWAPRDLGRRKSWEANETQHTTDLGNSSFCQRKQSGSLGGIDGLVPFSVCSIIFLRVVVLSCSDKKKLPYMAMLRNLRNMIKAGISPNHHNSVLRRLQDDVSS